MRIEFILLLTIVPLLADSFHSHARFASLFVSQCNEEKETMNELRQFDAVSAHCKAFIYWLYDALAAPVELWVTEWFIDRTFALCICQAHGNRGHAPQRQFQNVLELSHDSCWGWWWSSYSRFFRRLYFIEGNYKWLQKSMLKDAPSGRINLD